MVIGLFFVGATLPIGSQLLIRCDLLKVATLINRHIFVESLYFPIPHRGFRCRKKSLFENGLGILISYLMIINLTCDNPKCIHCCIKLTFRDLLLIAHEM